MTNSQKNYAISGIIIITVAMPMLVHLIQNSLAGINGPDLIYQIVYTPLGLWGIWAAPLGKLHHEFFPEEDAEK